MMMIAYCRMDFLKSLSSEINLNILDDSSVEKSINHINLSYFLLKGAIIKTDLNAEEIMAHFDHPIIKFLMKSGRLLPAKDQFKLLSENDGEDFFLQIDSVSSVLLIENILDNKAKQFEDYHGYHCINAEKGYSTLFEERIKNFQNGEAASWGFAADFLCPHNAMVIADPYLFEPETLKAVKELINTVASPELKGKYYLTLIGTSNKSKNEESFIIGKIENFKIELKIHFPNVKLIIEHHFCNIVDFHDRYIITNNTCVFSGFGLDIIKNGKTKKESTWVAFKPFKRLYIDGEPGVFFYKIMQDKLKQMRKWIDRNGENQTKNPLLIQANG